jgi:hypothetical protein
MPSIMVLFMLGGCPSQYRSVQLDQKTGEYSTSVRVDPGGILKYETNVNPTAFPIVLLATQSNLRASVFEFTMRNTLADLQNVRVMNVSEFRQYAADKEFELPKEKLTPEAIGQFSAQVVPVLVVFAHYVGQGGAKVRFNLNVIDGRSGNVLLAVDHPKTVWSNFDAEALLPVLNVLRRWYTETSTKSS